MVRPSFHFNGLPLDMGSKRRFGLCLCQPTADCDGSTGLPRLRSYAKQKRYTAQRFAKRSNRATVNMVSEADSFVFSNWEKRKNAHGLQPQVQCCFELTERWAKAALSGTRNGKAVALVFERKTEARPTFLLRRPTLSETNRWLAACI